MKKIIIKVVCVVVCLLAIVPMQLKAETVQDLQKKFSSYGGSDEGFQKIIKVVQDAQKANDDLKNQITNNYNKQLYQIMTADNFDRAKYSDIFNQIDQQKSMIVQSNLDKMNNLLMSLSLQDRRAYAQLLYSNNDATTNNTGASAPANSNAQPAVNSNNAQQNAMPNNNATPQANSTAQGNNNNQQVAPTAQPQGQGSNNAAAPQQPQGNATANMNNNNNN
ncbi:hypothetical protein ACFX5K_05675 [Rickettsiales bacterium LUAb2]